MIEPLYIILAPLVFVFFRFDVSPRIFVFYLLLVSSFVPQAIEMDGMAIFYIDVAILLLLLVFLFLSVFAGNNKFICSPVDKFIFFFILINAFILIWSVYNGNLWLNALREVFNYLRIFLVFHLFLNWIQSLEDIKFLFYQTLIFCAVVCVFGLYQFFFFDISQFVRGEYDTKRIYSFFGNPNTYGSYLEIMFFTVLGAIWYYQSKNKQFTYLLVFLLSGILLNILLTFSRGSFFCVVIFGTLYILLKYKRYISVTLPMIFLVFFLFFHFFQDMFVRQISVITNPEEIMYQYTIFHRIAQYLKYLEITLQYPLTGMGWGLKYIYSLTNDFVPTKDVVFNFGALNSIYFDFTVKSGIISLISFLLIFVFFMRYTIVEFRKIKEVTLFHHINTGFLFALCSLFLHQTMDNAMKFPQIGIIIAFFMAVSCRSISLLKGEAYYYSIE